jgi:hypothetical protein
MNSELLRDSADFLACPELLHRLGPNLGWKSFRHSSDSVRGKIQFFAAGKNGPREAHGLVQTSAEPDFAPCIGRVSDFGASAGFAGFVGTWNE